MCGINGIIFDKNQSHSNDFRMELSRMNQLIEHRGPDDSGMYVHQNVLMGMRRLSIIDITTGHQPMLNEDQSLCIVFNGEIYNYKVLRNELEESGVHFTTQSDTEVVLKMYERYGKNCVERLNGMFAFSIHDVAAQKVFIARDRFGEKPLYYTTVDHQFVWASELKSIINNHHKLRQISYNGLNLYLSLTYIPAPFTIFDGVYKLKAGHHLTVNTETLTVEIEKYWDATPKYAANEPGISYEEAQHQIEQIMVNAIEERMIADVPLGVFLSGGVDSSIVAAVMAKVSKQKIKTFSVGFKNKRYDESERAQIVADHIGSEHHLFILDHTDLLQMMDKVILNYDEPFADPSSLPTYFLSKQTANYVKVALTGDGGDEVFGGYNKYLIHSYGKLYKRIVPHVFTQKVLQPIFRSTIWGVKDSRSVVSMLNKMLDSFGKNTVDSHLNIIALGFKDGFLKKLLKSSNIRNYKEIILKSIQVPSPKDGDVLKIARYIDKNTSLEGDMLAKVDRASMLASLECRSPFLDHRLYELTNKLPDSYLISGRNKKRILKDTFEKWLPQDFFNAPKAGFEMPITHWFRNELKAEMEKVLSLENLSKHGLFHSEFVVQLIREHTEGKYDHGNKLWTLFCFQKWYIKEFEAAQKGQVSTNP